MARLTLELARRLLSTGAIAARDVEAALYLSVVRGVSIARALVDRGVLSERVLEEELSRRAGLPLRQVHPATDIVEKLPRGMCRMLAAVPLRFDTASGATEIAAVDPLDGHVAAEFMFHLGTPIRVQRATMSSIEEAIRRMELAEGGISSRSRRRTPAFPHGAPDTVPPSPPPSKPSPDEQPIPLVRRLSSPGTPTFPVGSLPGFSLEDAEPSEAEAPAASDPPLSPLLPASPDPDAHPRLASLADPSQARRSTELLAGGDEEDARPTTRRKVLQSAPDIPTTSFPSAPPPSAEDEPADAPVIRGLASVPPASEGPATEPDPFATHPVGEEEPTPIDNEAPIPSGPPPAAIPRTPDAGWSPSLPELLDLIARARGRDDLLELVLRAVTLIAQRAGVFVVRREGFSGWSCNPAFGSEEDLRRVVIPTAQPSIFATSAAAGFYLGPIPRTPVHAALLSVLGRASPDVAVYVAKARGRPTIVIVADQLDDTLLGTRALGEIAKRAGEALTRILSQR